MACHAEIAQLGEHQTEDLKGPQLDPGFRHFDLTIPPTWSSLRKSKTQLSAGTRSGMPPGQSGPLLQDQVIIT